MNLVAQRRGLVRSTFVCSLAVVVGLQMGCGPEDYQKPLQQFQDASSIVVNTTRAFLNNENTIEQNKTLDDVVFLRKPLNLPEIGKVQIISQAGGPPELHENQSGCPI